ncbi:hypothetical protein Y1Q_0014873 [Alligator mississippiensis]|uniref:Uncharacterized protein n=1 Tax=Alligator mississippiensis TaxID=8496 RepID=A0A151P4U7_ALLMI|nr:hypothetical protein Y1Q_0014873 [Alligator mississippiensis]
MRLTMGALEPTTTEVVPVLACSCLLVTQCHGGAAGSEDYFGGEKGSFGAKKLLWQRHSSAYGASYQRRSVRSSLLCVRCCYLGFSSLDQP